MFGEISKELIYLALREDIGSGDITTLACVEENARGSAEIIARESLVFCGHDVAQLVFEELDSRCQYRASCRDGDSVKEGEVISRISGSLRAILTAERTALNFLQRLSGIATATRALVDTVDSDKVQILDTRKTTPGWRELEKYAVRLGGGVNHRFGLYDAFLIKDNHIDSTEGGVREAVKRCRESQPNVFLQVEVRTIEELQAALEAEPDSVLLDNMSPEEVRGAVNFIESKGKARLVRLETSGGINRDSLSNYTNSGVDAISLGSLTHSVRSVDIALDVVKNK